METIISEFEVTFTQVIFFFRFEKEKEPASIDDQHADVCMENKKNAKETARLSKSVLVPFLDFIL